MNAAPSFKRIALIGFEHYMTERVLRQLTKELIDAVQAVSTRLN